MHPTELNALTTAITNSLYCSLDEKDFFNLALVLNMMSKEMLAMAEMKALCQWESKNKRIKKDKQDK